MKNEDRRRYRKQRRIFIKNSKRRYSGQGDGRVMLEVLGSIATIAATIVQAVSVVRLMKIEKELNKMYKRRSNERIKSN